MGFKPLARARSTDLSAVKTLAEVLTQATVTLPTDADQFLAQAQVDDVYYTMDGTAPSSTAGFRMTNGVDPIFLPIGPAYKFLAAGAGAQVELLFTRT